MKYVRVQWFCLVGLGLAVLAPVGYSQEGAESDATEAAEEESEAKEPAAAPAAETPGFKPPPPVEAEADAGEEEDSEAAEAASHAITHKSAAMGKEEMFLSTSSGMAIGLGDFSGGGATDFMLGYRLGLSLLPGFSWFATFRYLPLAGTLKNENVSYDVVVENYALGMRATKAISDTLQMEIDFDVGGAKMSAAQGSSGDVTKVEGMGGIFSVGGGIMWDMLEGFTFGPRGSVAFGSVGVIQLGGGATYRF